MNACLRAGRMGERWSLVTSILTFVILLFAMVLADSQPAYTLPVHNLKNVRAIPAFARKYGLPCSACHTAWPELNNFGMTFRDNGYQLNNDHDSPIYQDPGYFPITMRITPNWHRESTNNQLIDRGNGPMQGSVTTHGFDLSGMDIWATGTIYKNISFSLLPSSDINTSFHFENAYIRFDNLFKTHWLNLKVGKFELDNLISEKRFLFLSANGGLYQNYHFVPPGDTNTFGLGNNALGLEVMGHSVNSYTRYSVAVLSGNDGVTALGGGTNGSTTLGGGRGYDVYATFSQAFQVGKLGLQRLGAYTYFGQRPTIQVTAGGNPIAGASIGNKPFYRTGFVGSLNVGRLEFLPLFMHAYDNVYLGNGIAANMPLPPGAVAPTWNGGFLETHLHMSPQLVFTQRYELIRMSRQANPSNPYNLGNIDAYSVGYRWYPIMFSRGGLAFHNEYSITRTQGNNPQSGTGVLIADPSAGVWSNSVLAGFDFAF
jgi:hypothetical protein